jgi:lysozyme
MMVSRLREMIKRHEGLRTKVYQCPSSKWTIGYGRNLEDTGISEMEANLMLSNDIGRVFQECVNEFAWFNTLSLVRQDVIASMVFQMGMGGLKGFKKMLVAIGKRDFPEVAIQMLDSGWAKQTPARAQELARMMASGKYPD